MARDYAKTRKTQGANPRRGAPKNKGQQRHGNTSRSAAQADRPGSRWRAFLAGLMSGVFLSFLLYLTKLPAVDAPVPGPEPAAVAAVPAEPPKPRFDFYTMLPQSTIDGPLEPAVVTNLPAGA